jgi:hypothetical protein
MRVRRGEGLLFLLVDVPIHSVVLTVSCLAGLTVRRGLLALAWIWIGHNALLTQAGTHCPGSPSRTVPLYGLASDN